MVSIFSCQLGNTVSLKYEGHVSEEFNQFLLKQKDDLSSLFVATQRSTSQKIYSKSSKELSIYYYDNVLVPETSKALEITDEEVIAIFEEDYNIYPENYEQWKTTMDNLSMTDQRLLSEIVNYLETEPSLDQVREGLDLIKQGFLSNL